MAEASQKRQKCSYSVEPWDCWLQLRARMPSDKQKQAPKPANTQEEVEGLGLRVGNGEAVEELLRLQLQTARYDVS